MMRTARACVRPVIAVTSSHRLIAPAYIVVWIAIRLAGGKPRRVRPGSRPNGTHQALVLTGGPDLSPEFAGIPGTPHRHYYPQRDDTERAFLEHAIQHELPVLGICRGAQLINRAAGGTIHPAVRKAYRNARYPHHPLAHLLFRKRVNVAPNTWFSDIVGTDHLMVNSLHRQSVARLGSGLVATASEPNGVIQVIEDPRRRFFVGVQFHPELLLYRGVFRRLFRSLVAAAAATATDPAPTGSAAGETATPTG